MSPTLSSTLYPFTSVYQVLISICTAKAASQMEDGLETKKDKWRPSCQQLRLTDISPYASSGQKFTSLKALLRLKLRPHHNVISTFLSGPITCLSCLCMWALPIKTHLADTTICLLLWLCSCQSLCTTLARRSSVLHSNTGLCSKQPSKIPCSILHLIQFKRHKAYNGKAYIRYRGIREK